MLWTFSIESVLLLNRKIVNPTSRKNTKCFFNNSPHQFSIYNLSETSQWCSLQWRVIKFQTLVTSRWGSWNENSDFETNPTKISKQQVLFLYSYRIGVCFFFSNKTWIQRELKEKIKNMCHLYSKSLKLCVFYALKIDLKTQHYFETCFYTNMLVNTIYYI